MMATFRVTALRDGILAALADAPTDGLTGIAIGHRVKRLGVKAALSGVYRALEVLVEEGWVLKPSPATPAEAEARLDELLGALKEGDGFSKPVSFRSDGYRLTDAGRLAAQVALARRALAAGKPRQVEDLLAQIQRSLLPRKAS